MSSDDTLEKGDLAAILSRINNLVKRQEAELETTDSEESDDDIPVLTEIYRGQAPAAELMAHSNNNISGDDEARFELLVQTESLVEAHTPVPYVPDSAQFAPSLYDAGEYGIVEELPLSQDLVQRFLSEMQPLILSAVKVAVQEESFKAEQVLTQKLEQEILLLLRNRLSTEQA